MIRVTQNGIGWDIDALVNGSLGHDDNAEARGISVSRWLTTSANYEECMEILVRVWPDNTNVKDASIALLMVIYRPRTPVPILRQAGEYFLYSDVPASTAAPQATPTEGTTTSATAASTSAISTDVPLKRCLCYC